MPPCAVAHSVPVSARAVLQQKLAAIEALPPDQRLVSVTDALAFGQDAWKQNKISSSRLFEQHLALISTLPENERPAPVSTTLNFVRYSFMNQAWQKYEIRDSDFFYQQTALIRTLPETERLEPVTAALAFGITAYQDRKTDFFTLTIHQPRLIETLPESQRLAFVTSQINLGKREFENKVISADSLLSYQTNLTGTLPERERLTLVKDALNFAQQAEKWNVIPSNHSLYRQISLINTLPESERAKEGRYLIQAAVDRLTPNNGWGMGMLRDVFSTVGTSPADLGITGVKAALCKGILPCTSNRDDLCVVFERVVSDDGDPMVLSAGKLILPLGQMLERVRKTYPAANNQHRQAYEDFLCPFVGKPAAPAAA